MKRILRLGFIALPLILAAAVSAQSPVGTWTGKMDFSAAKTKNANEKTQLDMAKQIFQKMSMRLTMNKNKTYKLVIGGGPNGQSMTDTGKWSQSGKTITVTGKKGRGEKMTISPDGKKMTMFPPSGAGGPQGLKMVFSKV